MPRPTPSPLPPPLPSYTFAADGHSYNFVVDGPFAFLAVSQEGSGRALAFSFLETVRAEWAAKWADKGRTAPAGGLDRAFGPRLAAAAAHVAAHPDEASRVAGLQAQVDAVKSVMVDNIEQARGGRGRGREEGDGGAVNPPSALASSPRSSPAASASRPWSTRRTTCAPRPTGFSAPGPRCAGGREGGGGRAARPSPPNPPTRPHLARPPRKMWWNNVKLWALLALLLAALALVIFLSVCFRGGNCFKGGGGGGSPPPPPPAAPGGLPP